MSPTQLTSSGGALASGRSVRHGRRARESLKETVFVSFGLRVGAQADIRLVISTSGTQRPPDAMARYDFTYIQTDIFVPAKVERIFCCLLMLKNGRLCSSV